MPEIMTEALKVVHGGEFDRDFCGEEYDPGVTHIK